MRDAAELALDRVGHMMGGRPVVMIYEDDQLKPDLGQQKTDKLIQSDKVDLLTGYITSGVLLASIKSAVDVKILLIGVNAGPSQIAGELCTPSFFSTSWQGDQVPQAMGEYMNQKDVKSAFLIAPIMPPGRMYSPASRPTTRAAWSAKNTRAGPTNSTSPPNSPRRGRRNRMRFLPSIPAAPASSS
jgi:branched-chain amino acid transport system substrate-binding protein